MSKFEYAECPQCKKTANGVDEVESLFGFRINGGIKMVQSWCKDCRG